MPSSPSAAEHVPTGLSEDSPLLGGPGGASQPDGQPLYHNLFIGTGIIAQFGILLLAALIFASVFIHPPLNVFSIHPLLNISGLLLITETILLVQPTHTPAQKQSGALIHAALNDLALLLLLGALAAEEYNKITHGYVHFASVHSIMGLCTYILVTLQVFVGITMHFLPSMYGGVNNAKKLYKYHRAGGYLAVTLGLGTVAAATQTYPGINVLKLKLWAVLVCVALVLVGLVPRIRKSKFGL